MSHHKWPQQCVCAVWAEAWGTRGWQGERARTSGETWFLGLAEGLWRLSRLTRGLSELSVVGAWASGQPDRRWERAC